MVTIIKTTKMIKIVMIIKMVIVMMMMITFLPPQQSMVAGSGRPTGLNTVAIGIPVFNISICILVKVFAFVFLSVFVSPARTPPPATAPDLPTHLFQNHVTDGGGTDVIIMIMVMRRRKRMVMSEMVSLHALDSDS